MLSPILRTAHKARVGPSLLVWKAQKLKIEDQGREFGKYKGNGNMVINNSIDPQRRM